MDDLSHSGVPTRHLDSGNEAPQDLECIFVGISAPQLYISEVVGVDPITGPEVSETLTILPLANPIYPSYFLHSSKFHDTRTSIART